MASLDRFDCEAAQAESQSAPVQFGGVRAERVVIPRARPRQWHDILAAALAQHEAISVRGTVISHLRRTPTRAEITAARRAAHRMAASGRATILRFKPPEVNGPGSPHLILARPDADMQPGLFDELTEASVADRTLLWFEPIVMAQELATTVEVLSAAIHAISVNLLNPSEAERLLASLDASFEALRHIRRNFRREVSS